MLRCYGHENNEQSYGNCPINNGDRSLANKSEKKSKPRQRFISRRAFFGKSLAVGAGTIGAGLLANARAEEDDPRANSGDAAMLRFAAAAEILEADFWIQYNELAGIQDPEVPGELATQPIPTP